jgi:hypothetical protein
MISMISSLIHTFPRLIHDIEPGYDGYELPDNGSNRQEAHKCSECGEDPLELCRKEEIMISKSIDLLNRRGKY